MVIAPNTPSYTPVYVGNIPCVLCGYHKGMWRTTLTNREREIIALVAHGYSNKDIAEKVELAATTIKNHLTSITGKLNAKNRTMAVMIALDRGLILKEEGN